MCSSRDTATRHGALLGIVTLALLWLPSVSVAAPKPAPPPLQDSVTGGGQSPLPGCNGGFEVDARSGPSGENSTGQVTCGTFFAGPVTCLNVTGNVALLTVQTSGFGTVGLRITDNGATGDRLQGNPSPGCPTPLSGYTEFSFSGDLVVLDAAAFPTSKVQCKHRGWAQYGFKSHGQCVRFVRLIPGPVPYPSTKEQCRHGGWAQYGFRNERRCLRFVRLRPTSATPTT